MFEVHPADRCHRDHTHILMGEKLIQIRITPSMLLGKRIGFIILAGIGGNQFRPGIALSASA